MSLRLCAVAVLGVVLTHMRRSRAEEDPEPLLDLLGPRNQDSDGDTGLAMRVFGIASRPPIQQQEHMSTAERTELWKELEEKRLRSRVREAMGPGLGSVVLGLCSTCREAWAYRQADGWVRSCFLPNHDDLWVQCPDSLRDGRADAVALL